MAATWRAIGTKTRTLMAAATSKSATTTTATTTTLKAAKRPSTTDGKTQAKGITKPLSVSPKLSHFLGVSQSSRTDAVKKIWDHIKAHNLQNPLNKREIVCDEKLKNLFGKDKVGFLEISKLLSQHFVKTG